MEKTMLAGMEESTEFHEKRETCIRKKYNADEIGQRILNGDGGSWIKEPCDPDTIFQSDRYHIYQEILRKIRGKEAQETQNCAAITLRMKRRRMRWSVRGANNLAKALYQKENKELTETIDRYTDGLIFAIQMQKIVETLSAAKAPKKDGKGNPYADVVRAHMPIMHFIIEIFFLISRL